MRFIGADEIRELAPMPEMIDAVEAAYRDVADGRDRSPLRAHTAFRAGDLLLMPGIREGAAGVSVKIVTVAPGNAERSLPTVQAVIVWIDAATGAPLAILDGSSVTAIRTGAGTGAATRLLSRRDARILAMIGAGAQAEWQVRGVCAARRIEEVRLWSPSARRAALAERLAAELSPARVSSVDSAEEAVRGADIVTCATTSEEPVFDADWVAAGTHVNAVGAFRPGMVDLPPEVFARASVVAVDSRSAALAEAGDVIAAIERGSISADALVEIGALEPYAAGDAERDPEAITVFKSVGLAVQDAAAVELIAARAGIGGRQADAASAKRPSTIGQSES